MLLKNTKNSAVEILDVASILYTSADSRKTGNDWSFIIIATTDAMLAGPFCRPAPLSFPPISCCVRSRCRKRGLKRPHVRAVCVVTSLTILTSSDFSPCVFCDALEIHVQKSAKTITIQSTLFVLSRIKHKADDFVQIII